MASDTLNAIAQLIAATGVIASLFYLSAQIRQNTRSSRALVVDSLARSMHDLAMSMAQEPELIKIVTITMDHWETATEAERVRASAFFLGYFKLFENAWFQMRQGTLDREQWEGYDTFLRVAYNRSATKIWWEGRRAFFASGFRHYVEQCESLPGVPTLAELIQAKK